MLRGLRDTYGDMCEPLVQECSIFGLSARGALSNAISVCLPTCSQAEEAVSGSVWTSPPWLSHAQHILWDRSACWGVAPTALETHVRRWFRTWLCTRSFLCSLMGLRAIPLPHLNGSQLSPGTTQKLQNLILTRNGQCVTVCVPSRW